MRLTEENNSICWLYLQRSPYADAAIRFDVVEVTPAAAGWQVHCIKDAFQDN